MKFLSYSEAARMCGIAIGTVRYAVKLGRLKISHRVGPIVQIPKADVEKWNAKRLTKRGVKSDW